MSNYEAGTIVYTAKIDTKQLQSGAKDVEKAVKNTGDSIEDTGKRGETSVDKLAGAFGKLKLAVVAVGVSAGAFVVSAIKQFAEFEQVAGGAQKIFNDMDFKGISKDAQDAYKSMNISATDYLRIMNQVGANFASQMGDQKGYDTAKRGLQAIADYATGTGASIDILGDKFQAITRSTSTYQSIADQFAGVLPATSKSFLETAQNAGFLDKSYTELTQVPIAEYQEAISKMLEKGVADLNLAGNTAMETEKTISGSFAGMKSSWSNFTTALGAGDIETAKQALQNLGTTGEAFLKNVAEAGKNMLIAIKGLITEYINANPQLQLFLTITKNIAIVITTLLIPAIVRYIAVQTLAGVNALIAGAKMMAGWLMALGPIGLIISAVVAVGALIIANWETVKGWLSKFWDWLKGIFQSGLDWIKNNWLLIIGILTGPVGLAVGLIIKHFDKIKEAVSRVWEWIKGAFSTIGEIGASAVKGAVNAVLGYAERTINGFIKIVNGAISVLNKIPGVSIGNVNTVSIPKLAKGGIVTAPTLAMIGEGRQSEAVIPLDKLDEMLNGTGGGVENNIGVINIASEVDGERWLKRLSANQEIVGYGLTPYQTYGVSS